MEVADGYVLTASDYPSGMGMSSITWEQYTSPIHSDITINGSYSWGGMNADDNAELAGSGENGTETAAVAASATTTTTVTDTDYTYNGGQLTGEVITTTVDGTVTNTETLYYAYDASGTPVSVKYNNTLYFYVTNLQGDVVAIMNSSGTIVVEYTYDAWGYIRNTTGSLKDTLGKSNALRYRGYVYDRETGLYYLQSRYYNPGTGRFINADALVATGQGILGNNMFAYCQNNPVCYIDPFGDRIVGVGFQIELQVGDVCVGIELVVYFDPEVCNGKDMALVFYTYSGASFNSSELISTVSLLAKESMLVVTELGTVEQDVLLLALMSLMGDFGLSGGVFILDGNDDFTEYSDYSGTFDSFSGSLNVNGVDYTFFRSTCSTCTSYGFKVGVASNPKKKLIPFEFGYSRTCYSDPQVLVEVNF